MRSHYFTRRKSKIYFQIGVNIKIELTDKQLTDKQVRGTTWSIDLFGRPLCLAEEMKIDLRYVFKFILTPVRQGLTHIKGSLLNKISPPCSKDLLSLTFLHDDWCSNCRCYVIIRWITNWPVTLDGIAKLTQSILYYIVHFEADCCNNNFIQRLGYSIKI